MIEIEHHALSPAHKVVIQPAKPILGIHLLEQEEKQRNIFTTTGDEGADRRVRSGCAEIDDLLGGGVERGVVLGLSCGGDEGRLISLNLLITILLTSPTPSTNPQPSTAVATIIDTTGSFPLPLLAKILRSRLLSSQPPAPSRVATPPTATTTINSEEHINTLIQQYLERVSITRVFDIEGLSEVMGEIGEGKVEGGGVQIMIVDNMTTMISELFGRMEKVEAYNLLTLLSRSLYTLTAKSNLITILHNTIVSSSPSSSSSSHYYASRQQPQQQQQHSSTTTTTNPFSIFASNPHKPSLGKIFAQFPSLHLFFSHLPFEREDAEIFYRGGGDVQHQDQGQDRGGDEHSTITSPPSYNFSTTSSTNTSPHHKTVKYCVVVEIIKDETPRPRAENLSSSTSSSTSREQKWTALLPSSSLSGIPLLLPAFNNSTSATAAGKKTQSTSTIETERESRGERVTDEERERERVGGFTDVGRSAKIHGFGGRRV